jgi:hypothetical protein
MGDAAASGRVVISKDVLTPDRSAVTIRSATLPPSHPAREDAERMSADRRRRLAAENVLMYRPTRSAAAGPLIGCGSET